MSTKVLSLQEAVGLIEDGNEVAIAGNMTMSPMALVREIVRQGKKNLRGVTMPSGAINFDMLIGAGALASVEFAQIAMGEFGLALNFRRWVEKRRLVTRDHI